MPVLFDDMMDPARPVTRRELREELEAILKTCATKDDLSATREEMNARFDELRTHFNVVAEAFKAQFNLLHDGVYANVNSLADRVEAIEIGHGARLLSLETRVTRLETDGDATKS